MNDNNENISNEQFFSNENVITSTQSEQIAANSNQKKQKKNRSGALLTISIISLVLCVSSLFFSIALAMNKGSSSFMFPQVYTPSYEYVSNNIASNEKLDTPTIIKKLKPSVVLIKTSVSDSYNMGGGMGSGIVFSANGLIVTNAHVVSGADTILVYLSDGTEYKAELLGADDYSDLAVLKISATNLVAAEIGDSTQVVEGETVVAIGHPYSESLSYSSTKGIISGIRNDYNFENLGLVLDLFQHNAAINSGNSGGPLINEYGQVIGINSVKIAGDYENIGFAIQMSTAMPIIENLINLGRADRPMVGISVTTETTIGGALVAEIVKNGPADKAGMKVGDIITKINGQRVKTTAELLNYLSKLTAGSDCEITVLRDADVVVLNLILMSNDEISNLDTTNS